MAIRRFEDLVAWQKARELTRKIYVLTTAERFSRDFGLRDQIQRAAVSIMSSDQFEKTRAQAEEVGRIIGGLRASLKKVRSSEC